MKPGEIVRWIWENRLVALLLLIVFSYCLMFWWLGKQSEGDEDRGGVWPDDL